jgi:hypothetical protein
MSSGTFEDTVETLGGHPETTGKFNLLIRTVYTCDDGSGSFYAQKHVFLTITGEDSSTNTGPITFHGGTSDYTSLSGHGVDIGTAVGEQGVGRISDRTSPGFLVVPDTIRLARPISSTGRLAESLAVRTRPAYYERNR